MKVFWSWQSDTPGKTGRFLIRDALLEAISVLKADAEITEPTAQKKREELHLDQDRQGVSGSPDLAATILAKIDVAAVVVADVTPVGHASDGSTVRGKGQQAKKLMNPNVAIELGYALGRHSSEHLLMVLNEYYGDRNDLPFDLRHKAGPIIYKLGPRANKIQVDTARKALKEQFIVALRPFLKGAQSSAVVMRGTRPGANQAVWFSDREILATLGEPQVDQVSFRMRTQSALYLRVMPVHHLQSPISRADLYDAISGVLLFGRGGGLLGQNKFGAIRFQPVGSIGLGQRDCDVSSAVQLFPSGEIWAANFEFVGGVVYEGARCLPMQLVEQTYRDRLRSYLQALNSRFGIEGPYWVKAGGVGLHGLHLGLPMEFDPQLWGPIHDADFEREREISSADAKSEIDSFLLDLFEAIFDLAGYRRPSNLHGFPPKEETPKK